LMENEIKNAWHKIENELKNPLKVFCYPNGRLINFGEREIEFLKTTGHLGAVTSIPGSVKQNYNLGDQIYSLPRLALPDNMTDFIKYCSWIESVR
jgi:hypothetical protein